MEDIELSIQYVNIHPSNENLYTSYVRKYGDRKANYAFVKLNTLASKDRMQLRKLIHKNPDLQIVLISSNPRMAEFAWTIGALAFIRFPLTNKQREILANALGTTTVLDKVTKFRFAYLNGVDYISAREINYIQGQGDLVIVHSSEKGKKGYTKRIGQLKEQMHGIDYLFSVHQSFVINLNNITKLESHRLYFKNLRKEESIKLSKAAESRVRKALLWEDSKV